MDILSGYKTYIVAGIGLIVVILQKTGVLDMTADTAEISAAIWGILVIILKAMANKADKGKILPILLLCCVLCVAGCTSVTPTELARFKAQRDTVQNMAAKCETAQTKEICCQGLAEAVKAMDTMVTAAQD